MIPAQTIPDRVLIVLAAPAEARAARTALGLGDAPRGSFWRLEAGSSGIDLVESGVGKAQAAGATAAVFDPVRHAGVLSVGIGGAYAGSGLAIGERVLADASGFADEGIETPDGFETIASAGFPPARFGQAAEIDPRWRAVLGTIVDRIGGVATVSTCSGTDAQADAIRARTGAIAEAMEGAAVAAAVAGRAEPRRAFAEIRVISNTTGDRGRQAWDLQRSLGVLGRVIADVAQRRGDLVDAVRTDLR